MSVREEILRARKALLNGDDKLSFFEERGIGEETVRCAYVGYEPEVFFPDRKSSGYKGPAFTYPCISDGRLLAIHYKSEQRNGKNKRRQKWGGYADGLPPKGHGKNPDDPAKIVPFGLETLEGLAPESLVVLCCGEEDALILRQELGCVALSQPGAGLLEPVYAREVAGFEVVIFYDAGEEVQAHKDALKLREAGASSVRIVEWPPDAQNGEDINERLVEDRDGFREWADKMIATARPVSAISDVSAKQRKGEPDRYGGTRQNGIVPTSVGRLLSEVKAERVGWLWPGRIPKGKITVMDGNPGLGKSTLTNYIVACVSVGGPWPDGTTPERGGAVILNAEDGLADTIKPRLDAAGGDPSRILALATVPDGDSERMLSIPEDLDIIRRGIERVRASIVVMDPVMAFLGGDVNSHRDQDVRRALAPMAKVAEETGASILIVRHLNKATGAPALYRGGGSIGIVGAARSALLVAKDPDDEHRRVLASLKSNLADTAPSLAFVLSEAANGAVQVEWEGETHLSAAALLMPPRDEEERSALSEAADFLNEVLGGGPLPTEKIKEEAKEAGISWRTIERAKPTLGVKAKKQGMDGGWAWTLPDED